MSKKAADAVGLTEDEVQEMRGRFEKRVGGKASFDEQIDRFSAYWFNVVGKAPDRPAAALYRWMQKQADFVAQGGKPAKGSGRGPKDDAAKADVDRRLTQAWEAEEKRLYPAVLSERERPSFVPEAIWQEQAHYEARCAALKAIADSEVKVEVDVRARAGDLLRSIQVNLNRRRNDFAREYDVAPPGCVEADFEDILTKATPRQEPQLAPPAEEEEW